MILGICRQLPHLQYYPPILDFNEHASFDVGLKLTKKSKVKERSHNDIVSELVIKSEYNDLLIIMVC